MKAVTVICPGLLLLAATVANARERSTLSIDPDHTTAYGVELNFFEGNRPAGLEDGAHYCQWGLGYRFKGGVTVAESSLGSQLGFELEFRLGYQASESERYEERSPVLFALGMQLAMRVLTFNVPLEGQLVLHTGAELAAGGRLWWSEKARLGVLAGGRMAVRLYRSWSFEADYTLVPAMLSRAPRDLHVDHLEQRLLLTLSQGPVAIGARFVWRRQRATPGEGPGLAYGHGRGLGFVVELRPGLD